MTVYKRWSFSCATGSHRKAEATGWPRWERIYFSSRFALTFFYLLTLTFFVILLILYFLVEGSKSSSTSAPSPSGCWLSLSFFVPWWLWLELIVSVSFGLDMFSVQLWASKTFIDSCCILRSKKIYTLCSFLNACIKNELTNMCSY